MLSVILLCYIYILCSRKQIFNILKKNELCSMLIFKILYKNSSGLVIKLYIHNIDSIKVLQVITKKFCLNLKS